jgi:glycosyltransferase involved in cell wall biosynthesis
MLSVIIPTNNVERLLVPTLAALVPGAVAGVVSEAIMVDAGSTDGTLAIAEAAGCVVVSSESLADGLRTAAAQARAPWLMFLRPGFVPDSHWIDEVRRFVETAETASAARAATFRADGASDSRSVAREILALLGTPIFRRLGGDRGLLISKRFYQTLGGHRDEVQDADADLLRRIGRARITILACAGKLPPKPAIG